MEQFTIPQFIDVEDKIFGPITTRQFLILLVTGLILFIAFKLADFGLFITLCLFVGGFAVILAFVKINGQTFHYFLLNIVQTMRRPSRRLWRKRYTDAELKSLLAAPKKEVIEAAPEIPNTSQSRIRALSLVVNTGGYFKYEE